MLLERPGLTVLGAPLDQIFLMKLYASRAADVEDIEVLWEHCSYQTPEEAAAALHEARPIAPPGLRPSATPPASTPDRKRSSHQPPERVDTIPVLPTATEGGGSDNGAR